SSRKSQGLSAPVASRRGLTRAFAEPDGERLQENFMKTVLRISALALALLLTASLAGAHSTSQFGNIAERQRTSTVLGGTGLFNTFSTRTLYKGEFNFALFWNNFDRSPGALDI